MEALGGLQVSPEEVARRKRLQAAFQLAFGGANGEEILLELADILHFFSPGYTPEDMALQNAFKTIMHRAGLWADDDQGRQDIIRRLRSLI
jgi:hypothetical protein